MGDIIWLKQLTLPIKIMPCGVRLKFKGNYFI